MYIFSANLHNRFCEFTKMYYICTPKMKSLTYGVTVALQILDLSV